MDKIEELETKIKELSEEIERLKAEKENEPWKPKNGEEFYYLTIYDFIHSDYWRDGFPFNRMYELGNVFKTEEEANFRAEQLKVEAELRRFSKPFALDEQNYSIYFDYRRNMVRIDYYYFVQSNNIVFDSKEIAQKAIETVGEERIKKYYFGVDE